MEDKLPPSAAAAPLFCARCARELRAGAGDFFQITIEAVADPSPPDLSGQESSEEIRKRIDHLMEDLRHLSEREAMDQVYRRQVLHLCNSCYHPWIENPVAS